MLSSSLLLPHSSAKFLVGHPRIVLLASPHGRHSLRVDESEHAVLFLLPADKLGRVRGVFEKIPDELPQVVAFHCCGWNWNEKVREMSEKSYQNEVREWNLDLTLRSLGCFSVSTLWYPRMYSSMYSIELSVSWVT